MNNFEDNAELLGEILNDQNKKLPIKEKMTAKKLCKRWFIDAFTGMAQGLFATLIAGLILKQIGTLIGATNTVGKLLIAIGNVASALTGAGIGIGIAKYLKAPNLVIFTALIAGMIGAQASQIIGPNYAFTEKFLSGAGVLLGGAGDPIGAYLCALIATEVGLLVAGKTKIDIIVVPLTMMITTALLVVTICSPIIFLINTIGKGIGLATKIQPFIMGVILAVVVGILLTMPTSSAAIMIALFGQYKDVANLPPEIGLACGAAVVGCACHMVGFAVMSYRENGFGGLIAQGIGTSMLQIPNVMKKPIILVPPIIASAICGPIATCGFKLLCLPSGAGMGTSGFVGVLATIDASGSIMSGGMLAFAIILLFFVLPAIISLGVCELFRKLGYIKFGDLKI